MTVVDTLTVNISAATQAFEKGMKSARSSLTGFTSGLKKAAVGVAALAAAGTAAAIAMTKDFAEFGDQIDKMTKRTGFAAETLSELKFAAEQSGASIEQLDKALAGMARFTLQLERGLSTATDTLDMLGLSTQDLIGLNPEDEFLTYAKAIAEIQDPTIRAGIALQIFGRQGRELLPLLTDGAEGIDALRQEARDLGLVMSTEDATAAAEFTDAMNRLKSAFRAVSLNIGAQLAPAFTKIADLISVNIKPAMEKLRPIAVDLFGTIANLAATTVETIGRLTGEFIKLRIGILEFLKRLGPLQLFKEEGRKITFEEAEQQAAIFQEELNRAIEDQNNLLQDTEDFTKRIAENIRQAAEGFKGAFAAPTPERFPFEDFPIAGESLEEQAAKSLGGVFDFFRSIGALRKAVTLPNIPSAITPPRIQVAQATLAGSREAIEARIRHQLRREAPQKTEEAMLIQLKELVKLARERGGAVIEEIGGFVT